MTDDVAATTLKETARQRVERAHEALIGLSHWIQANPELNFQETLAVAGSSSGWRRPVSRYSGSRGPDTAFVGSMDPVRSRGNHRRVRRAAGSRPCVRPQRHRCLSHWSGDRACGRCRRPGSEGQVIGTPAEEGGGGKIIMIEKGVFDGVHRALMVHPGPSDLLEPDVLAAQSLEITYTGKPAHAGSYPERGINAADAMVVAQVAMGLLRQSLRR